MSQLVCEHRHGHGIFPIEKALFPHREQRPLLLLDLRGRSRFGQGRFAMNDPLCEDAKARIAFVGAPTWMDSAS